MALWRNRSFIILLVGIFLGLSLISVSADRNDFLDRQYELDQRILDLRDAARTAQGHKRFNLCQKLMRAHVRRVRLMPENTQAKWELIQDDLKFGQGHYALHLLPAMEENRARLRLMALNQDPGRQDQVLRTRPFTLGFFKRFWVSFTGQNRYRFSSAKVPALSRSLNKNTLSQRQIVQLARLDPQAALELNKTRPAPAKKIPAPKQQPTRSGSPAVKKARTAPARSATAPEIQKIKESAPAVAPAPPAVTPAAQTAPAANKPSPVPAKPLDKTYHWEVVTVTETVEVRRRENSSWAPAEKGTRLYEGNSLRTGDGSSVLLLIKGLDNEDSYSQLFENTELKVIKLSANNLDELDEVYLDLVLGEVLINVEGLSDESSFQVQTPTAVAGVRGTTFGIEILANAIARILVLNGVVGVAPTTLRGIAQEILVQEGHELHAETGLPPNPPALVDEATQAEYQAMAEQIATEIQTRAVDGTLLEPFDEEEEFIPEDMDELEEEPIPGVDPETGQLLDPDGNPVFDANGDPLYVVDGQVVDSSGNPVTMERQNTEPVVNPDGTLTDPLTGELILDESGNPLIMGEDGIVYDSSGEPVTMEPEGMEPIVNPDGTLTDPITGELILDESGEPLIMGEDGIIYDSSGEPAGMEPVLDPETGEYYDPETGELIDPYADDPSLDPYADDTLYEPPNDEFYDPNTDTTYSSYDDWLNDPTNPLSPNYDPDLDPNFDPNAPPDGLEDPLLPEEDVPFDPNDPFLPPENIDDEFPVAIIDLLSESEDGTNLIFEVTGDLSYDPGNESAPNNGIVKYEWDLFPFDGIIDATGPDYTIVVPLNTPEEDLDVKLTVYDADGNSSFTTAKSQDPFDGAADINIHVNSDPNIGDDANGDGTSSSPFHTILKAMSVAETFSTTTDIAIVLQNTSGGQPSYTLPSSGLTMRTNTIIIAGSTSNPLPTVDCGTNPGFICLGGVADFSDIIVTDGAPAFDFTDTDSIFNNVEIKNGGQALVSNTGNNNNQIDLRECTITNNSPGSAPVIEVIGNGFRIESSIIDSNSTSSSFPIIHSGASPCIIENTLIEGNSTSGDPIILHGGGSAGGLHLFNCTLDNSAQAIEMTNDSLFQAINTAFTGSGTLPIIDASAVSLSNCDMDHNFLADSGPAAADGVVDIQGTTYDLAGSVSDLNNPSAFTNNIGGVNPDYKGDFTPNATGGSPLVDAGVSGGTGLSFDVYDQPRVQDGDGDSTATLDIGAVEAQSSADPIISGRVFDSVTGESVRDAVVAIYRDGARSPQEVQQTGGGGTYRFNVLPGKYFLIINLEGYFFPSSRAQRVVTGDHGGVFEVLDGINQTIDMPVDSGARLRISKTANKTRVTHGEIITFNVTIANPYFFNTIENMVLRDALPPGFKYVSRSLRKDGITFPEPVQNGRSLEIAIPRLANLKSTSISYQLVVSTGVADGTYLSTAAVFDGNTDVLISNESGVKVEVVPDTLFTNGTLLGRVYHDTNQNGRYDTGEKGMKKVTLATEYGVRITTDAFGLFHLKNVPAGRHTLGVDPNSLPAGMVSGKPHGVPFEIFEGSLAKVNIPVVPESVENPRRQFFLVSLGEVTLRENSISGAREMVTEDDTFDDDLSVEGRGAFFLHGKILGKYLVTASYDSERLSRKGRYRRQNRLFTNLNPNEYYPIYGDASRVDYSAAETSDALFLLVEWDESFARWGSMKVNWPAYRRVMQGGRVVYRSTDRTQFDQHRTRAEGFYATSDFQATQEQFVGTGTSIYHLEHTPIIEGSEKVRVQFKNRFSAAPLYERVLVEQVDYTIDYGTGRLILTRPLTSTVLKYDQTIISNDLLAGAQGYLVVDYEYESLSVLDRAAFGGKVQQALGDHVTVEAGYAEEERDGDPYTLATTTTTLRVNESTSLTATYNESQESFAGGGISYDGGLTISSQDAGFKQDREGASWSVGGNTLLLDERLELGASYSEQDSGYSALASFGTSNTETLTADATYHFNESLTTGISLQNTDTLSDTSVTQAIAVVDHLDKTNVFINWENETYDARLEYGYQDIGTPFTGVRYLGALPPRGEQLAALRLGWKPWEGHHYYVIGQTTLEEEALEGLDNDMFTLGARFPVMDLMDIQAEGRTGTLGESVLAHLIVNDNEANQSHIGFETGTQDDLGRYETVSFAKTYLSEKGTTYRFVKDYNYYDTRVLRGDLMGAEIPLNENWSIGISYETSNVDTTEAANAISREVATFRYNFLETDLVKLFGKVEWREDHALGEDIKTEHIFVSDYLVYQATQDLSLKLKGALGYAKANDQDRREFDFTEGAFGFAYRPHYHDRLHLLGRLIYIEDNPLENRTDFIEQTEQRKNIASLDGVYDLTETVQLIEKLAWRDLSEKTGPRDWVDSETWLWVNGLNIEILENWYLGGEYRILENKTFEDSKTGYLLQISRDVGQWVRLTLGYNFTDFDDNLANRDDYDRSGGFFRLEGRY